LTEQLDELVAKALEAARHRSEELGNLLGRTAVTALVFLIQTVFGFYILAVMLRFLLQWVRADFYNPLVQFLVRITNPPLLPLRRIVPVIGGWIWPRWCWRSRCNWSKCC
jgi:hypothetical protein